MKGMLFIIDGLGDLPVEGLGGRTPLEAAHTPVLDRFARRGRCGVIDPIAPGVLPNTHSGAGMLLGMKRGQADSLKRGPVEAAGLGLRLAEGDIAFRANFATLERTDEGLRVVDRRAGRIREDTEPLAAVLMAIDLGNGVRVQVRPTEQHRAVLVLSGAGLDARVTATDPGDHASSDLLRTCRARDPAAESTAELVNRFSTEAHRVLSVHPINRQRANDGLAVANGVLLRGAGHPMTLENQVRQSALTASVVSGCNTVKGLGHLLGFRVVEDARFTADLDTDLEAKVSTALQELEKSDLAFVHIKAPDICAHDRNPQAKRDFLESIDLALAPLEDAAIAIAVAADHTTDSNTGRHTPDPVPALIFKPGDHANGKTDRFGESACRKGALPRYDSHDFLLEFLRLLSATQLR